MQVGKLRSSSESKVDCVRTHSTAAPPSPPVLLLDRACLRRVASKQAEKRVSGERATDPTPKHWTAAKAPRRHPDTPPDVLVRRKGTRAERQVLVAQIVYVPAERCTCQRFLMF